jgi:uncharacterized protein YjiS (DUF1127 family)
MFIFNHAMKWLRRTFLYNNTFHELYSLSDRELADLGISRGEIHDVVMKNVVQRIPSRAF